MIDVPEVAVERVAAAVGREVAGNAGVASPETVSATGFASRRVAGDGETLFGLSLRAAKRALGGDFEPGGFGGVVCATFSNDERFPALAVRLASALGMPGNVPAMDLQLACAAYPYALYVAGRLAADAGKRVLVVDGDVQSRLVDGSDASTAPLFSDAATATVVAPPQDGGARSRFSFFSRASDALSCASGGPVRMDGFGVFSFVATDVARELRSFGTDFDMFVPHQANMYMARQLAKSLGLEDRLVTCGAEFANPGSCSVPLALALHGRAGRALVAGFGAGLSMAACTVRVAAGAAAGIDGQN